MANIKTIIFEQFIPGYFAMYVNSKISMKYEEQQQFGVDLSEITNKTGEYIEQVITDLKEQHDRKKILDDKAKSLLFIITVSITAITFSLNYLNSLKINILQTVALLILGISILYFVFGTIRILQSLNIKKFHVSQAEVTIENKSYKLQPKQSDTDFLKDLIKCKQLNELQYIQKSNYVYASFNLIRNGIIFFALFFITSISVSYVIKKNETKDIYPVSKEKSIKFNDSIDVTIPYTFELKYDILNLEINETKE